MKDPDIISAIRPVVEAFEKLGVPYFITGSVASSAYGIARATMDVDMVSDLKHRHVRSFVEQLKPSYYIDEDIISHAIHRHSSFNLIHLETMVKVDVFVAKDQPYQREALRRRRTDTLDEGREDDKYYLVSCEDIILSKLDWNRMGREVSERQWNDVLGVLKVQEHSIDTQYLRQYSKMV